MMKEVLKEEGKRYMYDIARLLLKSQTSGNSIEREKERGTERGRKERGREGEWGKEGKKFQNVFTAVEIVTVEATSMRFRKDQSLNFWE